MQRTQASKLLVIGLGGLLLVGQAAGAKDGRLPPQTQFNLRHPLTHKIEKARLYTLGGKTQDANLPPFLHFEDGTLVGATKEQLFEPQKILKNLAELKSDAAQSIKKHLHVNPPNLTVEVNVAHIGHLDEPTGDITFSKVTPTAEAVENPAGVIDLDQRKIYLPFYSQRNERIVAGALIKATNEVAKQKAGMGNSVDDLIWDGLQRHFAETLQKSINPYYRYGFFQFRRDALQDVTEPAFALGSAIAKKLGHAKTHEIYFQSPTKEAVETSINQIFGAGIYDKIVEILSDSTFTRKANALRASDLVNPRLHKLAELEKQPLAKQQKWPGDVVDGYLDLVRERDFIESGRKERREMVAKIVALFPSHTNEQKLTANQIHERALSSLSVDALEKEMEVLHTLGLVYRTFDERNRDVYLPTPTARAIAESQ